jgi:hypothetical protein
VYQLADYLDEYGHQIRYAVVPPNGFWGALARHAHPEDLLRLATAAHVRRLHFEAGQLLYAATTKGDAAAARALIELMHGFFPHDHRPGLYAAEHVALDDAGPVASLLQILYRYRQEQAGTALLARDPASQVALDGRDGVLELIRTMHSIGSRDQAVAPAERAASFFLGDPVAVAELLKLMEEMNARGLVNTLLAHDPAAHVALDNLVLVALLVKILRAVGARGQVDALLARAPSAASRSLKRAATRLESSRLCMR